MGTAASYRASGSSRTVRPIIGLKRLRNLRRDIFLASLGTNVLSVAMPIVILQIYDRIIPNNSRDTLFLLIVGLIVVVLLDAVLRMARSYVTGWAGARFEHYAGMRIFGHMFKADMNAFEKTAAGVHLDRISSIEALRDYYAGQSILLLVDLPFALIFISFIAFLQVELAMVPIIAMACFALVAYGVGKSLRLSLHERTRMDGMRHSFIIEVLNGIHTIKSMAMEPQIVRRYERLQASSVTNGFALGFGTGWALGLGSVFSQVTVLSMAGFGAAKVIGGDLTIGGLAACILLAGRSLQPLVRAMGIWTQVQRIKVAEKRVGEVLELEPEGRGEQTSRPNIKGAVEFRGVKCCHDEAGEDTIKGLDLAMEPGEMVAITGKDGSGKSTLFDFLLGLQKPASGRVMIDGVDTDEFDIGQLRAQIGYLASSPTLYRGTIL